MLGRVREWYRAKATIPLALYSLPCVTTGDAEWCAGDDAGAPAMILRMRGGATACFRLDLATAFALRAWVSREPGGVGACTVTVTACSRLAVVGLRAVTVSAGAPAALLTLQVRAAPPVELTLAVEPTAASGWTILGSPTLLVAKTPRELGEGARAALRSTWRAGGLHALGASARDLLTGLARGEEGADQGYDRWVNQGEGARRSRQAGTQGLRYRPLISLVAPGRGAGPDVSGTGMSAPCLASVEAQSYTEWELVREPPGGDGLADARGEFVAWLRGDGALAPDALLEVARVLNEVPEADVVYADEDRVEGGRRRAPFFKPDWSPEYYLSRLYVGPFVVYRKAVVAAVGGVGGEPHADTGLFLRVMEKTSRIVHVSRVLWHAFDARPAPPPSVLAAHVAQSGLDATVVPGPRAGCFRVKWRIRGAPLVSVIIPTRDRAHLLERCLRSVETKTRGARHEIVVVDNGSVESETHRLLAGCGHPVVRDEGPFNFARLNNLGVRRSRGEHLVFLNNDTEVIDDDWLVALLELSQQPAIGAVGAKLFYPDGRLQHVGVVLGPKDGVAHAFRGASGSHPGYFDSALVVRNYSAVTGACLMTRRDVFESAGGFDEAYAVDYIDIDYCLRVRASGYRVAFTPHARLWHHEFATRPRGVAASERARFHRRWATQIAADPYFNANLSRRHADFRVGP